MRRTALGSSKRSVTGSVTTARRLPGGEPHAVLLGRREQRAAPSGLLDQRLDLARREGVVIGKSRVATICAPTRRSVA